MYELLTSGERYPYADCSIYWLHCQSIVNALKYLEERALSKVESMSRIEIWKCKPSWRALPVNKRQTVFHDLATLVKHAFPEHGQENGGPYVIQNTEAAFLIWTTELEEGVTAVRYESIRLDKYFEPLAYVAVTNKLDARVLATKLSVGRTKGIVQDG